MFSIMNEICRIKDDAYVSSSSPGGGTGRTSCNGRWRHRGRSLPSPTASGLCYVMITYSQNIPRGSVSEKLDEESQDGNQLMHV